ncbi:hypothetical protein C8R47DRAFT_757277 [Mycena vitilis]|nr:hypothetical protein C8R47DRAFT_757277 [Mycena vitilis]
MALFNTPSRIFRAFGGLFVLFGGGFYLARRIVSARRSSDLEDYRAHCYGCYSGQTTRREPVGLCSLPLPVGFLGIGISYALNTRISALPPRPR